MESRDDRISRPLRGARRKVKPYGYLLLSNRTVAMHDEP
jgi:hypothetical protein